AVTVLRSPALKDGVSRRSSLKWILADAARTDLALTANNATTAAVQVVKVDIGADAKAVCRSSRAGKVTAFPPVAGWSRFGADVAACAAILRVGIHIRARIAAQFLDWIALAASPLVANPRQIGADVAACAAVIGIQFQECAGASAIDGTLDAVVNATSGNARDEFI